MEAAGGNIGVSRCSRALDERRGAFNSPSDPEEAEGGGPVLARFSGVALVGDKF